MAKDEQSTYYDAGGIEVLEVIKAKLSPEQLEGYYLGNAIKYSLRANFKDAFDRDVEKLDNYSRWLREHRAAQGEKKPPKPKGPPNELSRLVHPCRQSFGGSPV